MMMAPPEMSMRLLSNFQAPEQTQVVWHSAAAREQWGPRISEISRQWAETERLAVAAGIKPCTLQPLTQDEYLRLLPWAQRHGLCVHVIKTVAAFQGFAQQYRPGTGMMVTALTRDPNMLEQPEQHLGYPECCQTFFAGTFPVITDPVWQWAGFRLDGRTDVRRGLTTHSVTLGQVPGATNPMLRYQNIRFVSHIPCCQGCGQTEQIGKLMRDVMRPEIVDWVDELLAMPIEWDCYRGVAIVKLPPFRIIVGSAPCADRHVVKANQGG